MGSDVEAAEMKIELHVSIHAPAWGATMKEESRIPIVSVSIHAPAWGATGVPYQAGRKEPCFNPRSRMGSDRQKIKKYGRDAAGNPKLY